LNVSKYKFEQVVSDLLIFYKTKILFVSLTVNFLDELFVNDASMTTTPPEKRTMMIETSSEWTNDFEDYPLKNFKIKMANTRTTMTTTTSNTTTMIFTSSPTSMSSLITSALTITSATTTTSTC